MTSRTNPRSSATLLALALVGAVVATGVWTNSVWQGNATRPASAGIDIATLAAAAETAKMPLLVIDNPI